MEPTSAKLQTPPYTDRLQQLHTQLKPSIWVWMSACIVSVLTLKLVTLTQFMYLPLWVCVIANIVFPIWCVTLFRSALCAFHLYQHVRLIPLRERDFYPTSDLIRKTEMHLVGLCFANASLFFPFLVYAMAMRESVIYPFGLILITLIGSVVLHANLMAFFAKNPKCNWFYSAHPRRYTPWQNPQFQNSLDQQNPHAEFFDHHTSSFTEENYLNTPEWQNSPMNPGSQAYWVNHYANDGDSSNPCSSAYDARQSREHHSSLD